MRLGNFYRVFSFIIVGLFFSCGSENELDSEEKEISGFNLNSSIQPSNDIYGYVNDSWMSETIIPLDFDNWGAINELKRRSYRVQRQLLTVILDEKDLPIDKISASKIAKFYEVGMDSSRSERSSFQPLGLFFQRIDSIKSSSELLNYLGFQLMYLEGGLFNFDVLPIKTEADELNLILSPPKLALSLESYLLEDTSEVIIDYKKYIKQISALAGLNLEQQEISDIFLIERKLGEAITQNSAHLTRKLSSKSLTRLFPNVNFPQFINKLVEKDLSIFVQSPGYFTVIDSLFFNDQSKIEALKNYLKWNIVESTAPYTSFDALKLYSDFHELEIKPRWIRVLEITNGILGEGLGRLYIENTFSKDNKIEATDLVENVLFGLADFIRQNDLVSDSLKISLLQRVKGIRLKVGYPDKWLKFNDLIVEYDIESASLLSNLMLANFFKNNTKLTAIGTFQNKWKISPQEVKMDYDSILGEFTIPAALFQPPYSSLDNDIAISYGAVGVMIARELLTNLFKNGETNKNLIETVDWDKFFNRKYGSEKDSVLFGLKADIGKHQLEFNGLEVACFGLRRVSEGK